MVNLMQNMHVCVCVCVYSHAYLPACMYVYIDPCMFVCKYVRRRIYSKYNKLFALSFVAMQEKILKEKAKLMEEMKNAGANKVQEQREEDDVEGMCTYDEMYCKFYINSFSPRFL